MTDLFNKKDVLTGITADQAIVGTKGYFGSSLRTIAYNVERNDVHRLCAVNEDETSCFTDEEGLDYLFFLPEDKVKEKVKEPVYRPFKSMSELTEIIYSKDLGCDNLSVGDSLWIRRKGDNHIHQKLLITSLGYDENDVISILISMNGKSMQEWLDNFEFLAHDEWQPFGVFEDCARD